MAGERDFAPQQIRAFVGKQWYVAEEHEHAGLGTPEFWQGWNQAMHLIHGYIMGDIDETGTPLPGEITRLIVAGRGKGGRCPTDAEASATPPISAPPQEETSDAD